MGCEADGAGCEAGVAEASEADGEADGEADDDDESGIAVGELLESDEGDLLAVMAAVMVVVTGTEKQPMLVCPARTSV